jgi:ribosome biogenesis protein Nip4
VKAGEKVEVVFSPLRDAEKKIKDRVAGSGTVAVCRTN